MKFNPEEFLFSTPFGMVSATYGEEGGPALSGPPAAVRVIADAVASIPNSRGMMDSLDAIEPIDLAHVCADPGSHIMTVKTPESLDQPPMLDSMLDDDEDDFDGQEEFDAIPADADPEGDTEPVMDGDFKGHPFRGNQHRKATRESGAAVGASIKAKRAERKGDKKALKSAHRGAHYAHLAAAEGATGQARKYHRTMAKFHGKQSGAVLDSALLDKADPDMIQKSNTTAVTNRGPVNLFSESDKVISLDDNKDYTVTGQRGYQVSVRGRSEAFHANRLKLASGKKPPTIIMDDATLDAAEGVYLGQEKKGIAAAAALLKFLRAFVRSDKGLAKNPMREKFGFTSDDVINKAQAQDMLTKLIDVAVSRKGGDADLTSDQQQVLRDFQHDARIIEEYFEKRMHRGGGRNQLRTKDMKARYPEIDNPDDFAEYAKRGGRLDGVEELPALRAQLAAATSTMERLRLAQAIKAARTAPTVAPPPPTPADNDASRVNALKRLVPKDDIRSDDPQLIKKLTAKLNYLSAWGDFMRKANKLLRKGDDAGLMAMGFTAEQLPKFKEKDFAGRVGFADYRMSNNNGAIGSTRKRLEAAMRDREPAPVPPPAPPAKSMAEVALAALQGLGWTVSQYGANVLVRSFVGMGKIGTMTVPDGTRNVYARVGDGELVVKYGEQVVVSSVTLAATEEEVQAQARAVNADTEAFAVAESRRTNPPKVDPADNAGYAQWASAVQAALQAKGMEAGAAQGVMDDHSSAVEAAWKAREPAQAVADRIAPAAKPAAGRFRYALENRPADFATLPRSLMYEVEPRPAAGQPHHDMARHGILVTERELTAQEVKAFELAPLIEGDDLATLANKVAESMAEYAAGHLEMAAEEPRYMLSQVMQTVERSSSGIRYSIGDPAGLVQMVVDKIKAGVQAKPEPTPPLPPGGGTQTADDMAFLRTVANGKHPDMLEPELADKIEAVLTRHANDKAIQDLGERAIVAYSNGLMAATGWSANGKPRRRTSGRL